MCNPYFHSVATGSENEKSEKSTINHILSLTHELDMFRVQGASRTDCRDKLQRKYGNSSGVVVSSPAQKNSFEQLMYFSLSLLDKTGSQVYDPLYQRDKGFAFIESNISIRACNRACEHAYNDIYPTLVDDALVEAHPAFVAFTLGAIVIGSVAIYPICQLAITGALGFGLGVAAAILALATCVILAVHYEKMSFVEYYANRTAKIKKRYERYRQQLFHPTEKESRLMSNLGICGNGSDGPCHPRSEANLR